MSLYRMHIAALRGAMRAYGARYRRALAAGSTAPRVKLH